MSKLLVTGTTGFIVFYLANALIKKVEEVVEHDNINDYYVVNIKYALIKKAGIYRDNIEWVTGTKSI